MDTQTLSPEKCYVLALKASKKGNYARAIKLMKIATLMAPTDERYAATLRQIRWEESQSHKVATPAEILAEAKQRVENGDFETARKLIQIAKAQAPDDNTVRQLSDALRVQIDAPKQQKETEKKKVAELTKEASLNQDHAEHKAHDAAQQWSQFRRRPRIQSVAIACMLLTFILISAANYISFYWTPRVDSAPYAEFLPVEKALLSGPSHQELILIVERSEWDALAVAQAERFQQAQTHAQYLGYPVVYLYDDNENFLGKADQASIYFR